MANTTLNSKIQLRNDTAANWTTSNPILLKGEMGVEIDTGKFKIGDGATQWSGLSYISTQVNSATAAPTTTDLGYEIGTLWLVTPANSVYVLIAKTETAATWIRLVNSSEITKVAAATTADKLSTPRTIGITGDGTGSTTFDGSANKTITLTLKNSGVAAGTYTKLTVDAKGIVTAAETIEAADLPTIPSSKISGLGTAATKNTGNASGNVVIVNAQGKIDESLLPAIAITEVYEVATQAAMLALTAQVGDIAIRTDESKCYILSATPASTAANWKLLRTPTDLVLSVNSKTGAVVLTTTDIAEGSNLYYTEARATANFNSNFSAKSSSGLKDGGTLLHSSDTFILNGGSAAN